jgi:predicted RNase H-like HicB family nuclease
MKFKIKIVFDFDENEYVVFVSELGGIEGRGATEQEAIENFHIELERSCNE